MKVAIASENPVKINAAKEGFRLMFPKDEFEFTGCSVPSGVNHQPQGDEETLRGAMNRAEECARMMPGFDYYVGIEGGVDIESTEIGTFAWIIVRDGSGKIGKGKSGTFFLPGSIAELVRGGMELGDASEKVFAMKNLKQKNGSIGMLTGDVIDRTKYYIDPLVFALIPFRSPGLYDTT